MTRRRSAQSPEPWDAPPVRPPAPSLNGKHPTAVATKKEPAQPQAVVVLLRDVTPRPVRWLWEGRVPLDAVTLIEGDPGLGKSTLTIDLAARVSRGWEMPPTGGPGEGLTAGGVLMLSAEDSLEQTIRPRLEAAEADLGRVAAVTAVRTGDDERPPVLPYDLTEVEAAIRSVAAKLVIVDPLMAYLDGEINAHKDQDVRRAMHQLKLLAERTGAAVVVVRHLTKMQGGPAMYRGGGSIGIIGAARSALLVAEHPDEPGARVVASVKSNLSRPPVSLVYRTTSATVAGISVGRIGWTGECDLTADDLSVRPEFRRPESKGDQAAAAIRDILAGGGVPMDDLESQLKAAGFSQNAIRDGKRAVKVQTKRQGFGPTSVVTAYLSDGPDGGVRF